MISRQTNTKFEAFLTPNRMCGNYVFFRFDSLFTAKRLFKARQGVKIGVAEIRHSSMTNEPTGFTLLG